MQLSFSPQPELVVAPTRPQQAAADGVGAALEDAGRSMQESLLRDRLFGSLTPATPSAGAGTAAIKAAKGWGDSRTDVAPQQDHPGANGSNTIGCTFTGRFSTMDAKSRGTDREVDFRLNNGFSSALPPAHVFLCVKRSDGTPLAAGTADKAPLPSHQHQRTVPCPTTACLGAISFELSTDSVFPFNNVKNKAAFGLLEKHKSDCTVPKEDRKAAIKKHTMRAKAHQPSSLIMITCRNWMSLFTSHVVTSTLHKNDGYTCQSGEYARAFTVECTYAAADAGYNSPTAWFQDFHCQIQPQPVEKVGSSPPATASSRLILVNGASGPNVGPILRTQLRALGDSLDSMNKDLTYKRTHIMHQAHQALQDPSIGDKAELKIREDTAEKLASLTEEVIVAKDDRYLAASRYRSLITYEPVFFAGFSKGDIGVWAPIRDSMVCRLNSSSSRAPAKSRVLDGGAVTAVVCLRGSLQRSVERCTEAMLNDFDERFVNGGSGFAARSGPETASEEALLAAPSATDGGIYAACYYSADVLVFGLDCVSEGCVLRIVGGGIFGNRPLQSLSTGLMPWELNCALYPPFTVWRDTNPASPHVLLSNLHRRKSGTPVTGVSLDEEDDWPASAYLHRPPQVHNGTSCGGAGSGHYVGLLWAQRETFTALVCSSTAVSIVFEGRVGDHMDPSSEYSPSNQGGCALQDISSREGSADTFDTLSPPQRSESPCVGSGAIAVLKRKNNRGTTVGVDSNSSSNLKNTHNGAHPPHIQPAPSYTNSLSILAPTLSAHMFLLRSLFFNNIGFLSAANGTIHVLSLPTLKPIGTVQMKHLGLCGETLSVTGIANHCPGTAAYQRSKLAVDAHRVDPAGGIDTILLGTNSAMPEVTAPLQSILLSVTGERDAIDIVRVEIELPGASWMGLHQTLQSPKNNNKSSKGTSKQAAPPPTSASPQISQGGGTAANDNSIGRSLVDECIIPLSLRGRSTALLCALGYPCFGGSHARSPSEVSDKDTMVGGSQMPHYVADTLRQEAANPLLAWIHSPKFVQLSSEADFKPVRSMLVKSLHGHSSWVLSTSAFPAPELQAFIQASYIPVGEGPEVLAQYIADLTTVAFSNPASHTVRNSFAFHKTTSNGLFKMVNPSSLAGRRESFHIANRSLSHSIAAQRQTAVSFGTAVAGMPHYAAVQRCLGEASPMTTIVLASVSMDQKMSLWLIEGSVGVSVRTQHGSHGTVENHSIGGTPPPLMSVGSRSGATADDVSLSHVDCHVQEDSLYTKSTLGTDLTNDEAGRTDHLAKVVASGVDGRYSFLLLAHKGKATLFDVEGRSVGGGDSLL